MKKFFLLLAINAVVAGLFAQETLTLTFQGQDQNGAYFQLDSVRIENLTHQWSETLIYPDTELVMTVTAGVEDYLASENLKVIPNPFEGTAMVNVVSDGPKQAHITVTDLCGRRCAEYHGVLEDGDNSFRISLSVPQMYIMTVQTIRGKRSVRLVNTGYGSGNSIAPEGSSSFKRLLFETDQLFVLGDEMRYTGYATIDGEMRVSELLTQNQMEDDTIGLVFFQDGIPCSNMPTVTDHEGNVYGTLQVGPQCWTTENMRAMTSPTTGTYIVSDGMPQFSYCGKMARWYNNDTAYAATNYGLLYNWNAVVDTFNTNFAETNLAGVEDVDDYSVNVTFDSHRRGICPEGWHVPTNAEWTALVNYVKSKSEYYCDNAPTKIAKAFASTTGWVSNSGACTVGCDMASNNALGFSAYPSGFFGNGGFSSIGSYGAFWTANQSTMKTGSTWGLYYNNTGMYSSSSSNKAYCYAVRCVRD